MDAILILLVFGLMVVPWIIFNLWGWVWFWVAIGLVLAISELISYIRTGKTLSQTFWAWRKQAKVWQKILILVGMIGFWAFLVIHLFLQG